MEKITVLFLLANPDNTKSLKLDEEIRAITEKIRSSEHRDMINLVSEWAVRPDDLLQALNEHKPQIVHFSSHGSSTGQIILVDDNRASKPVDARAVKALFELFKDNTRIVFLNACYSRIQAEAIRESIDCVIGMNLAIGDQAAITFAASFYRAIGFGRSVKEAFEQAKVALQLEGIPEDNIPELLCRPGIDPSEVFLLKGDPSWRKEKPFDMEGILKLRNLLAKLSSEQPISDEEIIELFGIVAAIPDIDSGFRSGTVFVLDNQVCVQISPKDVSQAIKRFEQGTLDKKHYGDLKKFTELIRKVRTSSSTLRIMDTQANTQHFIWRGLKK